MLYIKTNPDQTSPSYNTDTNVSTSYCTGSSSTNDFLFVRHQISWLDEKETYTALQPMDKEEAKTIWFESRSIVGIEFVTLGLCTII